MCVSKTLVAIKQGEFPGGRVLGDTGNRQDAGPHPTHIMHFFPLTAFSKGSTDLLGLFHGGIHSVYLCRVDRQTPPKKTFPKECYSQLRKCGLVKLWAWQAFQKKNHFNKKRFRFTLIEFIWFSFLVFVFFVENDTFKFPHFKVTKFPRCVWNVLPFVVLPKKGFSFEKINNKVVYS